MTAAPYEARYSQHQRELLVAAFLDLTLADLEAGADRWLDGDHTVYPSTVTPGVEPLLVAGILQFRAAADGDDGDPQVYVQAIASTCDAALHLTIVLCSGRDPLAGDPDPRKV